MDKPHYSKIKIGVSSCLLGENVRFDSGHKKNSYITGVLTEFFEFLPFCPEVKIGLGIPREPVRLVLQDGKAHCIGTKNSELDVTDKLSAVAEQQKKWQESLCGYIVKKDSPSCGMERVKLYSNEIPSRKGVGIYTKRLIENFPNLPVEEEGRLEDAKLRENFIQRVYAYSRWQDMQSQGVTISALQSFHARHKYIFMSHDQTQAKELGSMLADIGDATINDLAEQYLTKMMCLLKVIATRTNHVNTLHHIQGYLKNHLDTEDKAELVSVIHDYRNGILPLIVPVTLLRHHFRKHPNDYIEGSHYMAPHPGELMLLNNI